MKRLRITAALVPVVLEALFPAGNVEAGIFYPRARMRDYALPRGIYLPIDPVADASSRGGAGWFFEAGEIFLYEESGLQLGQFYVRRCYSSLALSLAGSFLRSPLGGENGFSPRLELGPTNSVTFEAGFEYGTLELKGFERESSIEVGCRLHARLTRSVSAGYTFSFIPGASERSGGIRASTFLGWRSSSKAGLFASLFFDRAGFKSVGCCCILGLSRRSSIILGYENGSGMMKGALEVGLGGFDVTTMVLLHPFLGMSEGAAIAWRR